MKATIENPMTYITLFFELRRNHKEKMYFYLNKKHLKEVLKDSFGLRNHLSKMRMIHNRTQPKLVHV